MIAPWLETMRPGFVKFHLGEGRVLHWITEPDGDEMHDHPFEITVRVLMGWYVEYVGNSRVTRREGDRTFVLRAIHRHRITAVASHGCLTLCTYGPHERETRFYRDGKSRQWDEPEYPA